MNAFVKHSHVYITHQSFDVYSRLHINTTTRIDGSTIRPEVIHVIFAHVIIKQ